MAYISSSSVCSAVLRNDIAKLSNLIKEGKRIDIQDNLGYTPLHLAARKLYIGCVTLLLQHPDCPINVQSFEGYTSLYLACANKSPPIKIIKSLLENGADPNIQNNEQIYPLHIACKNGNLHIMKMLLDYGADINVQDVDNDTPLHYAVDNNQKLAVQYLLKCGANTSLTNLYGLNPLMLSVARQNEDIFNMLLPLTADLNQQGAEKETTLSLAIKVGNYNMVQNIFNQDTDLINSVDYALGLEELYELDKLQIFKFIWSKVNHKFLYQNFRFIFVLRKVLTVMDNFEHLEIIFQTEDLNLETGNIGYIFENMFSVEEYPDNEYFIDKMDKLICIIKGIFKQDGLICTDGFKALCKFIRNCPYREILISTILSEADFIITEDCVLYAFSFNSELGSLCLQYCSHLFNPSDFFKLLTSSRDSMECLKYFIQFHTPGLTVTKETLQLTDSAYIKSLLEIFSGKVKSLTELCRDVVRGCVVRSLAQNSLHVNMVDFHQTIKKLDCPLDVQLFLLLKKPVNILPT